MNEKMNEKTMLDDPYRGTVIVIPDPREQRTIEHVAILLVLLVNFFLVGVLLS